MVNFEQLSPEYKKILNKDVRIFGEGAEYFARSKAGYVKDHVGSDFKGHILDYGCGIGLVAKSLRDCFNDAGVKIFAYDVSREAIRQACKVSNGIVFTYDFNHLKKESFDVIIIANVLHHMKVAERRSFLEKIVPLLNKNGDIFIFEHNPYNPLTRLVVRSSVIDRGASLLRLSETVKLLNSAGINAYKTSYITFFPKILKILRSLEPLMGRVPIGAQYMCVGKYQRGGQN